MWPRLPFSVCYVLCCTTILAVLALAVIAQGIDGAAICSGGDDNFPVKVVPAENHAMRIFCHDAKGNCTIENTVVMNEEARRTVCAPANGAPNTITVENAVAVQTEASRDADPQWCSPMLDDPERQHVPGAADFLNDAVRQAWLDARGSISTVSICGDPDKDVLVCGSGDVASAKRGESQLCGVGGIYQAVYTGMNTSGTNGCNGNGVRLYFTIVGVPENNVYSIYNLSFEAPVVTSLVILNGKYQRVTGGASPGVPVSVSVDVVNPLEGHLLASRLGADRRFVGTSRMQPGSCTGYCAFQTDPETTWGRLPMSATCTGATPNCQGGVTASSCAADVHLFESSTDDIELPYMTPDSAVAYTLNAENRVVVNMAGFAVPLRGVFVFNQTAEERVTANGKARDLSRAKAQVLPQDAQHKDVVVVRAGGEVVAASRACKFVLRRMRGTDRMYSVTNVLGEPTCDLVIGNGLVHHRFTLNTPPKDAGARDVSDYDALWSEADKLDEGDNKLPLILGLSLGLGLGLLAVSSVVVIILICCRRKKICCFANRPEHTGNEQGKRCRGDLNEEEGKTGKETARNPLHMSDVKVAPGHHMTFDTTSLVMDNLDCYVSDTTVYPIHPNWPAAKRGPGATTDHHHI